jgi:hypothetical protein
MSGTNEPSDPSFQFDFIEFLLAREAQKAARGASDGGDQTRQPAPLKHTVLRYDEPFEPATSRTDWDTLA